METWLPVVGFEGIYEVSSNGRVRSFDRYVAHNCAPHQFCRGRELHGWVCPLGYRRIWLQRDAQVTETFAHVLVAEAFIGPAPSTKHEVAHNDGDPSNNHFSNLRWATHAENMGDKREHGTHTCGERHSRAKLTLDEARAIFHSRERGKDIAARFGITQSTVCDIKSGRSWSEALAEAPQ